MTFLQPYNVTVKLTRCAINKKNTKRTELAQRRNIIMAEHEVSVTHIRYIRSLFEH